MKYLLIGLAVIVLIAAKPQQAQASLYNSPTIFSDTMPQNERAFVNENMFKEKREGFVTLSGDTFTPNWTGLMKVSGYCRVKYPTDRLSVSIVLVSGGSMYAAQSDESLVTFTAALPAQPVRIAVSQGNEFNFMGCNLIFESVK